MTVLAGCSLLVVVAAQETALPMKAGSVKFAVIGDMGTGDAAQLQTGAEMTTMREKFPFEFVLMLGDNVYGSQDFGKKFEIPYKALLDQKVPFYAALGNHDDQNEVSYKNYNMNGKRYYSFEKGTVKFFVLDSTRVDRPQLEWLDKELAGSGSEWKVAYFHHPLYSTGGTHGPEIAVREVVEPLLVKYGVDVVFTGHEHFYERIKPQQGITYFISGAGGQLRKGDLHRVDPMAAGYDQDRSFMLVEVDGHNMYFQSVTRTRPGGGFGRDSERAGSEALHRADAAHLAPARTDRDPALAGGEGPGVQHVGDDATMASTPTLLVTCVNRNGPSPRIFFASLSITARSAPTRPARSVLLITSRSDCVMPGPPLRGNLVAAGDVDDVDGVIREIAAELGRQVVAAAFHEEQLGVQRAHERIQRHHVRADVVADGGVRAAAGFHRADALGGQRVVAHQEFRVFLREDVVGHHAKLIAVAQAPAERQQQRRLAAAHRAADAHGERARAIVPRPWRIPLVEQSRDGWGRRDRERAARDETQVWPWGLR